MESELSACVCVFECYKGLEMRKVKQTGFPLSLIPLIPIGPNGTATFAFALLDI